MAQDGEGFEAGGESVWSLFVEPGLHLWAAGVGTAGAAYALVVDVFDA